MVVSAVVAVVAALPLLAGASWRAVVGWGRGGRYTTRSDFARGRYAVADADEDELLGSEEEGEGV